MLLETTIISGLLLDGTLAGSWLVDYQWQKSGLKWSTQHGWSTSAAPFKE